MIHTAPAGPSAGSTQRGILGISMSFACGMYAMNGADVVLGVDRLWVEWSEEQKRYVCVKDEGLKSVKINDRVGLAFTGDAICIAQIAANLYNDDSLSDEGVNVLEVASAKVPTLDIKFGATVSRLNEIIPSVRAAYAAVCAGVIPFSVILCGRGEGKPKIVYWSAKSKWRGLSHYAKAGKAFKTLPPEAHCYQHLEPAVNGILEGGGSSTTRIRKAIGYLAADDAVHTVGKTCVIRRLTKEFRKEEYGAIIPCSAS